MNKKLLLICTIAGLLTACSVERVSNFPSYKLTVQQGNQVNADALRQLQPGLTEVQVQQLLGTPALRDPFHANRWDYTYAVTHNGVLKEQKNLTLHFKDGVLATITGDIPNEEETEALTDKY